MTKCLHNLKISFQVLKRDTLGLVVFLNPLLILGKEEEEKSMLQTWLL